MEGANFVFHAAALKQVPSCDFFPMQAVLTNIVGSNNVIESAIAHRVGRVICLSTDKAVYPINAMGMTKGLMEKLAQAGARNRRGDTLVACVRYGNVMGSRGSEIPFFMSLREAGVVPITDPRMTRFMITLEQGVDLVWTAFETMQGGEIFVKKIPSMSIIDIAKATLPNAERKIIGIRPGEKIHEQMIGVDDAPHTYEYPDHYKI